MRVLRAVVRHETVCVCVVERQTDGRTETERDKPLGDLERRYCRFNDPSNSQIILSPGYTGEVK